MDLFVTQAETQIRNLINTFNWNYEELSTGLDKFVNCPNTDNHRVPIDEMDNHLQKCTWIGNEFTSKGPPLSESADNVSSVLMTPELQDSILKDTSSTRLCGHKKLRPVPKTSNQLVQVFNQEERLALYEYAVSNTSHGFKLEPEMWSAPQRTEEKRELTDLEKAAAERDAKRRRATYRNKVHTNRKTQTEIMKEVIASQMSSIYPDIQQMPNEPENLPFDKPHRSDSQGHSIRHYRYEEKHHYRYRGRTDQDGYEGSSRVGNSRQGERDDQSYCHDSRHSGGQNRRHQGYRQYEENESSRADNRRQEDRNEYGRLRDEHRRIDSNKRHHSQHRTERDRSSVREEIKREKVKDSSKKKHKKKDKKSHRHKEKRKKKKRSRSSSSSSSS